MPVMKLVEIIRDHIEDKWGIRKTPLLYVVHANIVPGYIGDIISTLTYYQDTGVFHEELIAWDSNTHPGYEGNNTMFLEVLLYCFQLSNHMISVKNLIRKHNGRGDLLALEKHNTRSSKWDIMFEKAGSVVCKKLWNGRNLHCLLPKYINSHHNAHGNLTRSADNISYGVPNEHVQVNRILNRTYMGY